MRAYLAKGVATGIPRTFGGAFIAMVLIPLILRNVGANVYGAWTLVFIFTGLSANFDIGIPKALVYLIPKTDNRAEIDSIFSASVVITVCLMMVVVAIGIALVFFQVPLLGSKAKIAMPLSNLLLLSGVNIICCSLLSSLYQSLLEVNYKIHYVNVIFFFQTALHYFAVFLVSMYSSRVAHLIYATNLIFITFSIVNVFSVRILTDTRLISHRLNHIKVVLHRGKDFFAIGLATSVLQPLTRYLVALLAVDIAANGVYDISLKIAMMAAGALSCFSVPLFSIFSGYGKKQIVKIKSILYKMTLLLLVLFTLGATIYLFKGEALLEFVFGAVDSRLFLTSLILLLGRALSAVFEPYVRAMWALGHTKQCVAVKFWGLFMTIVLVFVLSFISEPLYRIALSYVAPMLCGVVLLFFLFYGLYGFRSVGLGVPEK